MEALTQKLQDRHKHAPSPVIDFLLDEAYRKACMVQINNSIIPNYIEHALCRSKSQLIDVTLCPRCVITSMASTTTHRSTHPLLIDSIENSVAWLKDLGFTIDYRVQLTTPKPYHLLL